MEGKGWVMRWAEALKVVMRAALLGAAGATGIGVVWLMFAMAALAAVDCGDRGTSNLIEASGGDMEKPVQTASSTPGIE